MEISNLPDKGFKGMTVKMFKNSGEHWMNRIRIEKSSTKRKYKEEPNRGEENNN